MNIMWNRELDLELWKKLYSNCEKKYIRKRLLAIRYLYEGKNKTEVLDAINCSEKTLSGWIDKFFTGGLEELVRPIRRKPRSKLNIVHKNELIEILLGEKPSDYGINGDEWFVKNIAKLIDIKWGIKIKKSALYQVVDDLKEMSPLLKISFEKEKQLDLELWSKYYHYCKEEGLRKRLWAIKYLHEGRSRKDILNLLDCSSKSLSIWISYFRRGGLEYLLHPKNIHNLTFKLDLENKRELRKILMNEKPSHHGISEDVWTSWLTDKSMKRGRCNP